MFRFNRYFKQFFQLSLGQKCDFGQALCRLVFIAVQIKLRSIDWFWKQQENNHVMTSDGMIESSDKIRIAKDLHEIIRLASRMLPFACECVPRSFVLKDMLLNKGVVSYVQIGVRKTNTVLQSHAWVEVCGEAIGENEDVKSMFKSIDDISQFKSGK